MADLQQFNHFYLSYSGIKLPLKLVGDKPAFFYSLHVNEKPLGILVACRPLAAAGTLDAGFAAFKRIAVATRDGLQSSHSPAPVAQQTR